ncbi:uncharacterized protein LOC129732656 [Wyeomyia smithii]|uniref:uncharacterized protein LOC129732656 n=1 Tax=Wyeomyia smithii TaxID=174621 RepID=UPI0024682150|nr:uncharacterized protein LOC129732656 [Wyeomyia smithii]
MLSDNPNYFDEEVAANSGASCERSFFLFRKRNSLGKLPSTKQPDVEHKQHVTQRNSTNSRGFPRYRSNSTTASQSNSCAYSAPEYCNVNSNEEYYLSEGGSTQEETNINVNANQRNVHPTGQQELNCVDPFNAETRRHSIGTFNRREQPQKEEILDEVPEMMAPKAPFDLYGEEAHSLTTMDDIVFITARHNEQAFMWANHLKTCFDKITKQRGKLPFKFLHVKIDENQIDQKLVLRCRSTKLQIIIVCPAILTLSAQYLHSTLALLLKPEQVLGILLNVTETHVFDIHRDTFPSYNKWRICVAGDHEQSFLSELLGIATDILGCALRQQPQCSDQNFTSLNKPSSPTGLHDTFTLFPRKVKIGQNKVLAILTEPLVKNDWIKIKIEKTNDIIEITNIKRRNPYTIQFSIPDSCMEISMMIGVRLEKNNVDIGSRPLKCESQFRELEQILKTQDAPLEFLCQAVGISVPDRDKLDSHLLQAFQINVPTHFHLLNHLDSEKKLKSHRELSPEEYPSLLHFAAYWGLERLCLQLLECPGGDIACEMRNISGRTPGDLAEFGGHYKLADSIKNFSKMHEFSTMYHYFKGISDLSPNKVVIEPMSPSNGLSAKSFKTSSSIAMPSEQSKQQLQNEGYMEMNASGSDAESINSETLNSVANLNYLMVDTARDVENEISHMIDNKEVEKDKEIVNNLNNDMFSQECSNLLENCNDSVNNDINYLLQPSNVPVEDIDADRNYLLQPSNIPIHEYDNTNYKNKYQQIPNKQSNVPDTGKEPSHLRLSFKKKEQSIETKPKIASFQRQESNSSKKSVDDELLEIITDFKNNVFTIQEVEQLVQAWKSRNDVQQSFKDKQEQLQMMRQEYERIQQQIKEKSKRPNPFETMKKIFSRNKNPSSKKEDSNSFQNVCENGKLLIDTPLHQSMRPVSSSSNHSISSNSSGRIGAPSSANVGDNATHSDSEEQLGAIATTSGGNRIYKQNSLLENYMIPPVPRPVVTTPTTPQNEYINQFTSIIADEHYTIFPSNIPVVNDNSIQFANNCSVLGPIDEN